ncbi:MAG TPA: pilus (MSHA type) biogenesis protein MshL [Burkholderiales bacterium]|nr:pilus (MSHA type) biogenesis protein MshL [Burkholderiales bacterium]
MRTIATGGGSAASAFQVALLFAVALAGCTPFRAFVPTSEGHIDSRQAKVEPDQAIPAPVRVTPFVPPPKPAAAPQTYSVVVNEVPVKELLLALARDTKQNIDIHPTLSGLVSLNAINETLPAILERVSKQVNMRYRTEGNTIVVSPDTPYVKTYRIGYVNMVRDMTSTVGVSGEIVASGGAGGSGGTGGAGGGGGAAGSSGSSTVVRTTAKNDFWVDLRDNLRGILNSTRLQSLTADAKAERLALVKQEQELRVKQMEAASRAGQGAQNLATSVMTGPAGAPQQSSLLPDDVVVNGASGTVTVNATERQHQLVQSHIDSIVNSIQRQVLIEATIVEVQLSNNYQAGIDWTRVSQSGGIAFTQALLGNNLAVAPFFALFFNQNNQRQGDINLTVRLLEQFGNTRVLSSPKLMALNNQTALLKVVDNIVYFEVKAQTTQAQTTAVTTVDTTAKTVAVGVVMGVTPQINEDGRVSLTVRPTITRLNPTTPFVNDPNPSLCDNNRANCLQNRVPQVQVREMESVLQIGNGQTVILGGLMQDDVRRNRDQVPFAGNIPNLGDLFSLRTEQVTKSELVIFLKTTVVNNPSLNSDELKFFQRFLPQPETPPDVSTIPPPLRAPDRQ